MWWNIPGIKYSVLQICTAKSVVSVHGEFQS